MMNIRLVYILISLLFCSVELEAQTASQFNGQFKISYINDLGNSSYDINGAYTAPAGTVFKPENAQVGDRIIDGLGNMFQITSIIGVNGSTISTESKALNNIAPYMGAGIIYHPSSSGYPMLSAGASDVITANVINTANVSIDANIPKYTSGTTVPTSSYSVGDVVQYTGDSKMYKLTGSGWSQIADADITTSYSNPVTTTPAGSKGDVVLSYWDNKDYVYDGANWVAPTQLSSFPVSSKYGDVFYNTTDKKIYMMSQAGTWNVISGSTIPSGSTANRPLTGKASDLYYDTDKDKFYVYTTNNGWVEISKNGSTPIGIINPDPASTKVNEGDLFYNTSDHRLYVYNGTAWIPSDNALGSGQIFVGNASNIAVPVTMSGDATVDTSGKLTISNAAVTDAKLDKSHIPLNGFAPPIDNVAMGDGTTNNRIINLANPTAAQDAATKNYVDVLFSNPTTSLALQSGNFFIGNASNKAVATTKVAIPISGFGNATGSVSMGDGTTNYKITNLLDPTVAQDAATKNYVDKRVITPSNLTLPTGNLLVGNATNVAAPVAKNTIPLSGFGIAVADVQMGDGTTNYKITNLLNPVAAQDAATKNYVDSKIGTPPSSPTAPTNPKPGDTYYNTTDNKTYVYNGTTWIPVDNTLPSGQLYVGNTSNIATATAKTDIPISGFGVAKADVQMGDGTTNYKLSNLLDPIGPQDAATKNYVDNQLSHPGTSLALPSGNIFVGDATGKASAMAKNTVPFSAFGAAITDVAMGNASVQNHINFLADPLYPQDAATKNYVDTKIANPSGITLPQNYILVGNSSSQAVGVAKSTVPLSDYGAATADIAMGNGTTNYKITNVLDPVADQDVATKKYVDSKAGGTQSGGTFPTTPAPKAGDTFYNTGDNNLYVYNGMTWVPVTSALPNGELFVGNTSSVATPTAKNAIPISGFGAATTDVAIGSSSTATYKITNVTDPSADQEVATKHYVDSKAAGGDMKAIVYDGAGVKEQVVGLTSTQTLTNKTLDSPTMTGIPTAPTAVAGTNTTQVATTAFVNSAMSGSQTFASDFKVNGVKNFLKWTDGQTVPAQGKTAIQLLIEGASLAVSPAYTAPTLTLSSVPAASSPEIGVNLGTITLSSLFTQNDAGSGGTVTYYKNGTALSGNTDAITSLTSTISYTVTQTYAQGPVKLNNLGNPDATGQIAAGSVTSAPVTFTPSSLRYYGFVSSQTPADTEVQALQSDKLSSKALTTTLSYSTPNVSKYICFRYPIALGAPSSIVVNGFPSTAAFTVTTGSFKNAQGYTSSYYLIVGNNAVINTSNTTVSIIFQ